MTRSTRADIELMVTQRNAEAAFSQLEGRMRQMMSSMDAATKRQAASSRSVGTAIGGWAAQIGRAALASTGFLGVFQTINTVAGFVRRELEAVVQAQQKAHDRTMPFARSVGVLSTQLPQDADMSIADITRYALATQGGRDPSVVMDTFRHAISADPVLPVSKRLFTARQVLQSMPFLSDEDVKPVTTASLVGTRTFVGPEATEQQIMEQVALVQAAQSVARQTEPKHFAELIGRLAPVSRFGYSQRDILARAAAIGTSTEDPTGERTATGMTINMALLHAFAKQTGAAENAAELERRLQTQDDAETQAIRQQLLGALSEGYSADTQAMAKKLLEGQKIRADFGMVRGRSTSKIAFMDLLQFAETQADRPFSAQYMLREVERQLPGGAAATDEEFTAAAMRQQEERIAAFYQTDVGKAFAAQTGVEQFRTRIETSPEMSMRRTAYEAIEAIELGTRGSYFQKWLEETKEKFTSKDETPAGAIASIQLRSLERYADIIEAAFDVEGEDLFTQLGIAARGRYRQQRGLPTTRFERMMAAEGIELAQAQAQFLKDPQFTDVISALQLAVLQTRTPATGQEALLAASPEEIASRFDALMASEGITKERQRELELLENLNDSMVGVLQIMQDGSQKTQVETNDGAVIRAVEAAGFGALNAGVE